MQLSVIVPAYNEETRLPETLRKIDEYLKKQDYSYEILVIDDGSKDKTREIVENLRDRIKNLKVIGYKKNKGKGYAVRLGMLKSKGEYCLFTDADNSIPIEQIEKFWPEFKKNFEVVIGSRVGKETVINPPQLWRRTILTKGFILLRKIILNLRQIKDTQAGFKCFKKEIVELIFPKSKINGFAFDIEILLLIHQNGFNIKEVSVYCENRPESKVGWLAAMEMILDLFRIKKIK